ncbi:hypothetical protein NCC49_006031 [Naganishia albida]|nr:hypothetical protein NCC49_006031 [Naganishia albida]
MKIVLFKAPSHPGNKRSQSGLTDSKQKAILPASKANISANNTFPESVMLITALSNPLLYQRPDFLPPLQRLIQSLEVAHSTVEAYAAGDYLTENPVNVALGRVSLAWTDFISPLNAIHGLKAMSTAGSAMEARLNARKAVGQKLLALAKDKQSCVVAIRKLKQAYEDGSDEGVAFANKQFDSSLVRLIQFATMMATIEHALQVSFERVTVKVIADGPELLKLKRGCNQK